MKTLLVSLWFSICCLSLSNAANAGIGPMSGQQVGNNLPCSNPKFPLKTITAVNRVDCDASVDPTFNVYFGIGTVHKGQQTIRPRASCEALRRGNKVKLIFLEQSNNKKYYDIYVCNRPKRP